MTLKRIVVVGVSASGKSTFARKLGKNTHLPVIHIDSVMWKPGWKYVGDDEAVSQLVKMSKSDQWIIEGYIAKAAQSNLFEMSDKIIYLDYPGWLSGWRYIKRCLKHRKNPRLELPGSPEKFSLKFLWLVLTKGETWKLDKLFETGRWSGKIIRFSAPAEAEKYLHTL